MNPKLTRIVEDIEEARQSETCRDCLADILLSGLNRVLDDMPDADNARTVAAATLSAPRYALMN
jgi:hypothetical protein